MKPKLTLYSREGCCLCAEMKHVIQKVAAMIPVEIVEVDIDGSTELREKMGEKIPLLFIDGRKAFKYRVTPQELERRLRKGARRTRFSWFKKPG
jgi:glutaredoxin